MVIFQPISRNSFARRRVVALIALLSILGAACGSTQSRSAVLEIGATPVASTSQASTEQESGGHQYGVSIEEWTGTEAIYTEADPSPEPTVDNSPPPGYETLAWDDLIAPGFSPDEIYARFEDRLATVEAGSPEANALYEEMQAEYEAGSEVNDGLDGAQVQLAGFVAPLSFDEDVLSEFLLVPYFGACIHVPPPPPNQTILVTLDESSGLALDDTYGAVWVTGTLTLDAATTDLAEASYTMTGATSRVYET